MEAEGSLSSTSSKLNYNAKSFEPKQTVPPSKTANKPKTSNRTTGVPSQRKDSKNAPEPRRLHPQKPANEEQKQSAKIKVSNLSTLVSDEELKNIFAKFVVIQARIIYYGPKSTGTGWIELEAPEEALKLLKEFQGFVHRDKPMQLIMEHKTREVRRIQREKKRQSNKPMLPYQEELDQVQKKFGLTLLFPLNAPYFAGLVFHDELHWFVTVDESLEFLQELKSFFWCF
eukprot:TRINITY_DN6083_c0_g1_i1.p1 TRINITY_DN6083_c0_g1~~TRINITY_DN6083_c0_g1_i1.p1  ORF type:complete len:241 (+),score=31.78 TRINITY_DN6083_c0_g1_i1:37-723(+)